MLLMRRSSICITLLLLTTGMSTASAYESGQPIPGRFIVKLTPNARPSSISASLSSDQRFQAVSQLQVRSTVRGSENWDRWHVFHSPRRDITSGEVLDIIGPGNVEHIEQDRYVVFFEFPSDSLFDNQWYLYNTGQTYLGVERVDGYYNDFQTIKQGTPGIDIGLSAIYQSPPTEATRVVVAIVDSGTDLFHPELIGQHWRNRDEVPGNDLDDDHNGFVDDTLGYDVSGDSIAFFGIEGDNDPSDQIGHGTHVGGIVAGTANGFGVVGIAPNVELMSVKIRPNATSAVGAAGIVYAVNAGAHVINISWGTPFQSVILQEAMEIARLNGVFVPVAAGNSSSSEHFYPAAFDSVFAVAAGNSEGFLTSFSTWGEMIDLVAPGEDILSLRAEGTDMYAANSEPLVHIVGDDGRYYLANGTSMAAPTVAGAAALLWSIRPDLTLHELEDILRLGAVDMVDPFNVGDSLPGPDSVSGHGYLNIGASLDLLSAGGIQIVSPIQKNRYLHTADVMIAPVAGYSGGWVLQYTLEPASDSWITLASGSSIPADSLVYEFTDSEPSGHIYLRLQDDYGSQTTVSFSFVTENRVEITNPQPGQEFDLSVAIVGSAYGIDLDYVRTSYESAVSPLTLLDSVSGEYFDSVIYSWNASGVPPGEYSVILAASFDGQIVADTVSIVIKSAFAAGWPQPLAGRGSYSAACDDLDGDGTKEIVVGTVFGLHVFYSDGQPVEGFPLLPTYDCRCIPAIYDVDRDGEQEILFTNRLGVFAANFDGSMARGWPRLWANDDLAYGYPTMTVTKLGAAEDSAVVCITDDGTVLAYRFTGDPYFFSLGGWYASFNDYPTGSFFFGGNAVTATDLNGDGLNEVVATFSASSRVAGIALFDARTGQPAFDRPEPHLDSLQAVYGTILADLNEDDLPEIITVGYDPDGFRRIWVKTQGIDDLPGWPVTLPEAAGYRGSYPTVADLDRDGSPEILCTFFEFDISSLYVFRADGSPYMSLDGRPTGELYSQPVTFGPPIVADLTGDLYPEIVIRSGYILPGTGQEQVHLLDYTGIPVEGWPIATPARPSEVFSTTYAPLADDLDGDGLMELVLVGEADEVYVWNFDASSNNGENVGRLFVDNANSSQYKNFGAHTDVSDDESVLPGSFSLDQNYPNPFNPSTRIGFSIERLSDVSLIVFNVLGRQVESLIDGKLRPGTYSVVFDGSEYASGTYFYRLSVDGRQLSRKMVLLK
ncbi:MAG: S8 family peptidase [Candidatus Zixiibacteriota bacterium]|nr:MAG: S8 family peptidase [candidate division Zixibacteria bacterium]